MYGLGVHLQLGRALDAGRRLRRLLVKAGTAAIAAMLSLLIVAPAISSSSSYGLRLIRSTNLQVSALRSCEVELGRRVWPHLGRRARSVAARQRGLRLWSRRRAQTCGAVRYLNAEPTRAISYVFGSRGGDAIEVARCETGGTFWVGSHNGQYLGLFQMGSSERRKYGHGSTALRQARAARRYFVASGSDWSPWDCKP